MEYKKKIKQKHSVMVKFSVSSCRSMLVREHGKFKCIRMNRNSYKTKTAEEV